MQGGDNVGKVGWGLVSCGEKSGFFPQSCFFPNFVFFPNSRKLEGFQQKSNLFHRPKKSFCAVLSVFGSFNWGPFSSGNFAKTFPCYCPVLGDLAEYFFENSSGTDIGFIAVTLREGLSDRSCFWVISLVTVVWVGSCRLRSVLI